MWTTSAGQNVPGRVGIGTTGPATNLEVSAASAEARITSTGGGNSARLTFIPGGESNPWYIYGLGRNLVFQDNVTERARIDSSGRLLVGTSSDSGGALFQVNGDRIRIGTAKTPASASATGTTGEICWDANYIYVAVGTNTWKRAALSSW